MILLPRVSGRSGVVVSCLSSCYWLLSNNNCAPVVRSFGLNPSSWSSSSLSHTTTIGSSAFIVRPSSLLSRGGGGSVARCSSSSATSSSNSGLGMAPHDDGDGDANNNDDNNINAEDNANNGDDGDGDDDPYLWLEEVESEESMKFAKSANEACLAKLGNPETSGTGIYERVLAVLESKDRIPHVSQFGRTTSTSNGDEEGEQPVLYNFWRDGNNPKGLWRKTTGLESYKKDEPDWTVVLDVDALAKEDDISWVWKGSIPLPRSRDDPEAVPGVAGKVVTRAMLQLSRGGSDAVHIKEFDLIEGKFVADNPFCLPEAKSRIRYKSRNVVLVGTDTGPDSLTDSGYPRTVREWVRGTDLADAPIIFEGEKQDVSVGVYIDDERIHGGGLYEVHYRSLTFYTSKYWVRKIQFEHMLEPNHPRRVAAGDPPSFTELLIQDDASMGFLGNLMVISLRSDWQPVPDEGGRTYKKGSVLYVNAETFLTQGPTECEYNVLFEPTDRTAYEYYTTTKNYLVLSVMDEVKSRLEFYKIAPDGSSLDKIIHAGGGDDADAAEQETTTAARIRDCSVRPIDPYEGSDLCWFTTSDFTSPSTLYLADLTKVEEKSGGSGGSSSSSSGEELHDDVFIEERLKSLPPQYDATDTTVSQKFATSKDGTLIPYFIIMKKGAALNTNGNNPTLVYGYGGFEVSLGPHYIATSGLAWIERGGVYVEANIRGGGEFGPSWHQAALKENRHKAYEDFIAVAEHLVSSGVCKPETLAVRGGSNGGLLVANMYIMRPDLFGAIHCAVPLVDMKRYHKLLAGASWMAEYGDPDTEDWELFLQKYSPYHNIDKSADYPPLLVTTSTRDDRVHPAHARKFVKKLWDVGEGKWPVYYYENIEGGHGGAADAKQQAFMTALAYDFMFETLTKNAKEEKTSTS